MKINNRRDFIKKATLAGASAVAFPQLLSCANDNSQKTIPMSEIKKDTSLKSTLIVPKNQGLQLTGAFLDEIGRASCRERV